MRTDETWEWKSAYDRFATQLEGGSTVNSTPQHKGRHGTDDVVAEEVELAEMPEWAIKTHFFGVKCNFNRVNVAINSSSWLGLCVIAGNTAALKDGVASSRPAWPRNGNILEKIYC